MSGHKFRSLHGSLHTSLSSLVVPIKRPTGYWTARSRRQDLSLLNAQFHVCWDMRFKPSHDFEMRKHDKRVATQDIGTARRKI